MTPHLQTCQQCGGRPALKNFLLPHDAQWFVECGRCGRMTMHYSAATLAVTDWNCIQNDHRQPRYLGEV